MQSPSSRILGRLKVQIIQGEDLGLPKSSWWTTSKTNSNKITSPGDDLHPYVVFTLGKVSVRSITMSHTSCPHWPPNPLMLPIEFPTVSHQPVHLLLDVYSADSFALKAGAVFGLSSGGTFLGSTRLNVTDLVQGNLPLWDDWVTVYHTEGVSSGKIRVLVQYTCCGLQPMPGDGVEIIPFGDKMMVYNLNTLTIFILFNSSFRGFCRIRCPR